ncbi:HEAT repeat domain-containing protein [uncultured Thiohalocapsa sp.]|uniref:HEAT repeat domain-containing protein n=1 Tax=uncultured Thiohalocapsa sp. TaxID=768990 RepID=UPI0025F71FE4|nr:HEAT repeat domain-containing protein [uncultured Thiohalocapsa sp.]
MPSNGPDQSQPQSAGQARRRGGSAAGTAPAALLQALDERPDAERLSEALAHRHYRVVARAAEVAADGLHYALEPALMDAFRRFAALDHKRDPGCLAKGAIARALVALDCLDATFYREGIALRQPEPVWGGSVDTAADVRASCAMGLAASGDADALADLVDLLVDPEHRVRAGAVRAIGCTEPRAAEAVLRTKALLGDAEPEVTGECFRSLLGLAPETAPAFVGRWLDEAPPSDPVLAELAALALGESKLDAAVDLLRRRWEAEPLRSDRDRTLLRAAALARTPRALDWLTTLAADADAGTARRVIEELGVHRGHRRVAQALHERLAQRGDAALLAVFETHFGGGRDGTGGTRT